MEHPFGSRVPQHAPARIRVRTPLLLISFVLDVAWLPIPASTLAADQYEYDAAGRLFRVTYHTGLVATYTFDDNDNLLSITTSLNATGAEGESPVPLTFSLGRAHPNPGAATRFAFSLPHSAPVTVRLFDTSGRLVATVVDGDYGPGLHRVDLPSGRWAAGVYYYRLETPGYTDVRKFVHVK